MLQSGFRPPCHTFYQTFCQLSTGEILQHWSVRPICCIRHDQPRDSAAELTESFGIVSAALKWFQSYLTSHTQYIRHGTLDRLYSSTDMWCSTGLCAWADLVHHIYSWPSPTHPAALPVTVPGPLCRRYSDLRCMCPIWRRPTPDAVLRRVWNPLQTGCRPIGYSWTLIRQSSCGSLLLGVFIDQDPTMKTHVQWTACHCFAMLHQLRIIHC